MKKIAVVNDLSGFGKCSLVADISVLTAMGHSVYPVTTAVLTAQTGFARWHCEPMTQMLPRYTQEWRALGARFDAILVGFLMSEAQADEVLSFIKAFRPKNGPVLLDPISADSGRIFDHITPGLIEKLRTLAEKADILTPNVSELCLLADAGMKAVLSLSGDTLTEKLAELSRTLLNRPGKCVIVTGVPGTEPDPDSADGAAERKTIGNLVVTEKGAELIRFPSIGTSYSGTGDLFAAAVLGGDLNGRDFAQSTHTAGEFILRAVRDAHAAGTDPREGAAFEAHLPMLRESV